MTCMADGVYVVADSLEELLINFEEVLHISRNVGLTFKPKKIVIASSNTTLFGWMKIQEDWLPNDHAVSPICKATELTTAKQLCSFVGSYKQLSECICNYTVFLHPLEKAVAGPQSAESMFTRLF